MHSQLSHIASELIRFKSVDFPETRDQLFAVISWIKQRLRKNARSVFLQDFHINGKPALYAAFSQNNKSPTLLLNGHLDVVPAEENQFQPFIKSGKLFGRGAHDMKSGCAVMISLIEHFAAQKKKPDVGFLFVTDEEFHGDQSRWFSAHGFKPKLFIPLEPTNLDLIIETKGILWLEGRIIGKAVHGSMPWLGKSPIELFHEGLKKFYKKFPPLKRKKWQSTFNIGEVMSGDSFNRTPPDLRFKMDIRYIAADNPKKIIQAIKACFPKNMRWIIRKLDPPHDRAKDMSLILKLKRITEDMKLTTRLDKAPFCTDARFFAARGISCAVFGPKGANMHGLNEWVDLKSLEQLFKSLKVFALSLRAKRSNLFNK